MTSAPPPRPKQIEVRTAETAGSSRAAEELAGLLAESLSRWAPTASLGGALAELDEVRALASHPDWSAEGDKPMSLEAYEQARGFLQALLPWGPQPSVSAEPNGEPAFDWSFGPDRWLVASISETGRIDFASRRGSKHLGGSTGFIGSAPTDLLMILADLQHV